MFSWSKWCKSVDESIGLIELKAIIRDHNESELLREYLEDSIDRLTKFQMCDALMKYYSHMKIQETFDKFGIKTEDTINIHDKLEEFLKNRARITGLTQQKLPAVCPENLCDIQTLRTLGSGGFGVVIEAKLCNVPTAAKLQWGSSVVTNEIAIMKKFNESNIINPHIIMSIAFCECPNLSQIIRDNDVGFEISDITVVLFMELAEGGSFMRHLDDEDLDVYIFHLTYGLLFIKQLFPKFKHLDWGEKNVFFRRCVNFGCTKYTIASQNFWVPNVGFQALIGDFGISTLDDKSIKNIQK
jgi:Protein kinase domain.